MTVDPATNARFTSMGNGTYSERISDQVQLFYNPTTQETSSVFNNDPYLFLNGTYMKLSGQTDMLRVDFTSKITETFPAGIDPVTNADLSNISVGGLMTLLKVVFDAEYNARAAANALAAARSIISGAAVSPNTDGTVANFTTAISGLAVTFTDTSVVGGTATLASWAWDFGDNLGSSTFQNPVYTYTASGTYTVSMAVVDSSGAATTISQVVTV